jgi:hypothetical protein
MRDVNSWRNSAILRVFHEAVLSWAGPKELTFLTATG